ncbi:MAG TPA: hypothetical protein VIS51_08965 [Solirubrobacterales bacterium]
MNSASTSKLCKQAMLWVGLATVALATSAVPNAKASEFAYLAFDNSVESLALANQNGAHPRILLTETSTFYWGGGSAIALSPDGRYVAFCANVELKKGAGYKLYMYLMDVNTETLKWSTPVEGSCGSFDFSPGGHRLLFNKSGSGLDIWELSLDEKGEPDETRQVVGWGGNQLYARFATDGEHIIFSSTANSEGEPFGEEEDEFHLFWTDLEGGNPTDLTSKAGIFYALEPDVRLDNEWYVFSCGFRDPETKATTWSICRASLKTGELINLNVDGWAPQWTPDGTAIVYNVEVEGNRQIKEMDPSGENQEALPLGEFSESTADGVSNVSIRQTSSDYDGLARIFQPALRLDEGERWRPLELDKMFEEIPPRVCIKKKCEQIYQVSELAELSESNLEGAVLDIPPLGGEWDTKPHVSDPDEYGAEDCDILEEHGIDCEDPEHSAIYYDTTHVSPGGYQYLEYWFFYRFNDSPLDKLGKEYLDHEADWENVSVAIPYGIPASTFDYVTFAQHGSSYAYLREGLTCNEGNECGGASKHVDVYVAGGTHASYGESCSGIIPCVQSNGITPETDHGGEVDWFNNGDAGALQRLPEAYSGSWLEGPQGFTDWPGMWGFDAGFTSHVSSPANGANQDQFETPWLAECYGGGECQREEEEKLRSSASVDSSAGAETDRDAPERCRSWFGSGVSAVLCSRRRLEDSLAKAAIGRRNGSADLAYISPDGDVQMAPATGGLAQLAGDPLRPGDMLKVSGDVGKNAVLLIRTEANGVLSETTFALPERASSARVVIGQGEVEAKASAAPVVVLGDGQRLEPSSTSAAKQDLG